MERRRPTRRDVLKGLTALTVAAGVGDVASTEGHRGRHETRAAKGEKPSEEGGEAIEETPSYAEVEPHAFFDDEPDFLREITDERGEWSPKQRKQRRRTLEHGELLFDDVGLSFYRVQDGDTISEIRERLVRYPEFAHLAVQQEKLESFNIPARKLRGGMWLPIPIENARRRISEAQFVAYAADAVEEIAQDEVYGKDVARILERVSHRELMATMIAIAKQEGGGKPLGQFELHRWENHHLAFSFSYFHVLMKGPGLRARRKLNLTEGQLYHPINAVKLFLAFLVEKCAETGTHPDRFFPLFDHEQAFARFYNGRHWEQTNPDYLKNIRTYYDEAARRLSEDGLRWRVDALVDDAPETQTRE